ncbi:MAG: hypothetical protein QNJ98_08070 [Planctomycetota bacterium]|nr:hypothetical protein [Planctomycetota bacterium]
MPSAGPASEPRSRSHAVLAHIGRIGAFLLGAILLLGAYTKVIDPVAFAEHISKEGLDFLLPSGVIVFVALALELGLGAALMLNMRRLEVLIASSVLVLFFLYLTGMNYYDFVNGESPAHEGCGCFGNLISRNPEEAFWQDLIMLLPTCIMAWLGRPRPEALTPMWKIVFTGAFTIAGLVFTWIAPELPLDNLATKLKPGVDLGQLCVGEGEDKACFAEAAPQLMDDPDLPDERYIAVIADPNDESIHEPLNAYANRLFEEEITPLVVLTSLTLEEVEDLLVSELAPSFELMPVPRVLLRPMYRALPRSFLVKDGKVVETVSGLPPFERWAGSADE